LTAFSEIPHGDAEAQSLLGSMYSKGQGVAQDYMSAHVV